MIRTGWLAAFLLTAAPWTCFGQYGQLGGMGPAGGMGPPGGMGMSRMVPKPAQEWTVKVETFGTQSVTGKLGLDAVVVKCDLGTYEIKPEKIKTIEFAATEPGTPMIVGMHGAERKGTVTTSTGETVSGTVAIPNSWRIETDLGFLTPDAQHLKTFTFVARVQADASQAVQRGVQGGAQPNPDPSNGAKKPGEPEKTSPKKPGEPEKTS